MIKLINVPEICSGDFSQVDTSNLLGKTFAFQDTTLGFGIVDNGVFTPFSTGGGLVPIIKLTSDIKVDPVNGGLYIEHNATAVLNCMQDGVQISAGLDTTFTPNRIWGGFNPTGTSIKFLTL